MKTCFKCGEVKDRSQFYRHGQMRDGLLGKCKTCTRADSEARRKIKEQDPVWMNKERDRHLAKSAKARKEGRDSPPHPEATRNWRRRNREKMAAHNAVARALRKGTLTRQPCHCGEKAEAHHEDYAKPLEILWLCSKHHAERHVELRREIRLPTNQPTPTK